MQQDTVIQNMKQFFIKNGKKNIVETQFAKFFKEKSLLGRNDTTTLINKSLINATTYVFLKTRRRGKRVKYKVSYLEKFKGEKKALLIFSKMLKEKRSNKESYTTRLDKGLNVLSSDKNALISKRDELHKIALENIPSN
jgi:ribosomal protein S7